MSYETVLGIPKQDGLEAATPEQRANILHALLDAGFPTE